MTRRNFFYAGGGFYAARRALASEGRNTSFSLQNVEGTITPPEFFFVRDHFSEPEISLAAWTLRVEGKVSRPLALSFADVLESPTKKLEAVLECAGNGPGGAAVSNAVWEGVPIASLLDRAGASPDATSVILEGADAGRLGPALPNLAYSQVVPVDKCLREESIVAFKFNDRFLPRKNGFPARALLPGWYGMDSVKWLQRIVVLGPQEQASDFHASGMDGLYNRVLKTTSGEKNIARLTEVAVKSAIAWPPDNARLPAGTHSVRGFAWAGSDAVRSVSLSFDGGRNWTAAKLASQPRPFTWVGWQRAWRAAPGDHVLLARAVDARGREQPLKRDPARQDGYEWNICSPVRCSVR